MSVVTPDQRKILLYLRDNEPLLLPRIEIALHVDLSWNRVGVCLRQMEAKAQVREVRGQWEITHWGRQDLAGLKP